MVWGVLRPSGFGKFWPEGDFDWDPDTRSDGLHKRLKAYYLEQDPDERRRLFDYSDDKGNAAHFYPGYVADKFIHEIGTNIGADMPPLTPIEPHEPPRSFRTLKPQKSLGSLIELSGKLIAVDDTLKRIIERVEPGIHQFFPLETIDSNSAPLPKKYHLLVVGQFLDSFSPGQSDAASFYENGPTDFFLKEAKIDIEGLAFSAEAFGKAHLWKERRLGTALICISDTLRAAIVQTSLSIPKHYQMKEI